MRTFRAAGTAFVARLDTAERAVLRDLVDDVLELLDAPADDAGQVDGSTGERTAPTPEEHLEPLDVLQRAARPRPAPQDPALRRLLPDASRDDPAVAAEFRRLTDADLRGVKVAQLRRLRAVLTATAPDLVVSPAEAPQVAAALTDLRLVTAERLGVRTDEDTEELYRLVLEGGGRRRVGPGEARRRFLATVHVVLSMLQESLVDLMLERLDG